MSAGFVDTISLASRGTIEAQRSPCGYSCGVRISVFRIARAPAVA